MFIIQVFELLKYKMFTGQKLLYSSGGQALFNVPVARGTVMSEGAVPDTCEAAGMRAVCSAQSGCSFNSARSGR